MNTHPNLRVMIADDEPAIRGWFADVVGSIAGLELVAEARGVEEALRLAEERRPDLVVLDIGFPDGSGVDALKAIKGRPNSPMTIMFSNYAQSPYPEKCRQAGADHFFDKSTEFEAMEALLRSESNRRRGDASGLQHQTGACI